MLTLVELIDFSVIKLTQLVKDRINPNKKRVLPTGETKVHALVN